METIDIQSLRVRNDDWILDLGCGEGRHTIACDYHFPFANCIGLDLDHNAITLARKKHTEFAKGNDCALYSTASGFELPFKDHAFDHVICSEVLEHISDYESIIEEINRVLKPNGSFNLSIPRAWPEKICWFLSTEYHSVEGGHVRIFNARKIKKEIEKLRFSCTKRHYAHALHTPYWWLRCLYWKNGKENFLSNAYHKVLVWDLIKKPRITRLLEKVLNPIIGKSVVYYFKKESLK